MTGPNPQEGGKPDWRDYGPWETCGTAIVRTQFIQGDPTRPGFIIADLHSCPIGQREEISRLIAAAPALLEAVQNFVAGEDALFAQLIAEGNDLADFGFPFPLVDALRAALLQATGGEKA